jgi:hypothetical protein
MEETVGAEARPVLADGYMSGEVAVEIFAKNFVGTPADTLAQGLTNTDTFSRHPDSHAVPQSSMIVT